MPLIDRLVDRAIDGIRAYGPDYFRRGLNYNRMHGRVLGTIAEAAVELGLSLGIDMSHLLNEPYAPPGRQRRQLQARPDLTLFIPEPESIWGLVEYESIDINRSRLPYKRYLLTNWPPTLPDLKVVMVVMTVPDKPVRRHDSPTRDDLQQHKQELIEAAEALDPAYCFLLLDPDVGVDVTRFEGGAISAERTVPWGID